MIGQRGSQAIRRAWPLLAALGLVLACAAPAPPSAAPTRAAAPAAGPTTAAAAPPAPASAAPPVAAERPAAPPVQVKTGYIGTSVSNAGIFIAAERGYFQEEGLTTDLIAFDGGVRMVP